MKIWRWMMKRLRMTTANLLLLLLMTMHKVVVQAMSLNLHHPHGVADYN